MQKAHVFADAQFRVTDWLDDLVPYFECNGVNVKKEVQVIPQGGNPGSYKETSVRWDNNNTKGRRTFCVVHMNTSMQYDPQKLGKVISLDFTFHLKNIQVSPGTAVKHAFIIQQQGVTFGSPRAKLNNARNWHGFVINDLTATYFKRIDNAPGQPHPDFSPSGGALRFGYAVYVTTAAKEGVAITGVDNWRVTVLHEMRRVRKEKRDNGARERERYERLLIEERLRTEQEVRQARLKAEEEVRKMQLTMEKMQRKKEQAPAPKKEEATHSSKGNLTKETSEAKSQEYLAVVKAVQTKLRSTTEQHKADKEAWEKAKEELQAKKQEVLCLLEAERKMKESIEMKLTSDFEKLSILHSTEKQRLDQSLNETNEAILQYRQRIQALENQLAHELSQRARKEEELKILMEDSEKDAALLRAEIDAVKDHCDKLSRDLGKMEYDLKTCLRERDDALESLRALQLEALERDMDSKMELEKRSHSVAELQAQCRELEDIRDSISNELQEKEQAILVLRENLAEVVQAKVDVESLLAEKDAQMALMKKLYKEAKKNLRQEQQFRTETEKVLQEERKKTEFLKQEVDAKDEAKMSLMTANFVLKEEKQKIAMEADVLRARVAELEKAAEEAREQFSTEKELRERVGAELNLAVHDRKEMEVKHEVALAMVNAKLRKQTLLTESLKLETDNIPQLLEQLESERLARSKAEDALKSLDEIFSKGVPDEAEDWELVTDEELAGKED